MGNTTVDHGELLDKINDEKAMRMLPVIVYASCVMLVGLLGNVMVCFYYGRKTRVTSNSTFIMALAVFDLITCVVSTPIEIVDLRLYYTFQNAGACKVMRFVNHFASVGSTIILFAIATDRYRKICSPFKSQLTVKKAKVACVIAGGVSVMLACPALVFYEPVKVSVKNPYNIDLIGSDCTTTKSNSYRYFLWAYNGVFVLLFIVVVITLAVVYCFIGRVIYRHHQMLQSLAAARDRSVRDITLAVAVTDTSVSIQPGNTCVDKQLDTSSEELDSVTTKSSNSNDVTFSNGEVTKVKNGAVKRRSVSEGQGRSTRRKRPSIAAFAGSLHIKTMKYTTIMLAITIACIVSYVPYLALVLWRTFKGGYEGDYMTDAEDVLFNIGLRSYLMNAAINPIMYGFFNRKFRKYFYGVLCPCCTEKEESPNFSITSDGH